MTRPHPATLRQAEAADPAANTWLSANAGSGKTRVLTDRVARLLMEGTEPQHILCLTYTKAAAAEMQNRLFRKLGSWAMLPDAALRGALGALGVVADDAALPRARRLFARAIETPGGLKIQTIHAFCAGLLRRFPLEAGVSPGFAEMDDRAAARLRADVLDRLAEDDPQALAALARHASGEETDAFLRDICAAADGLSPPPSPERVRRALELDPQDSRAALAAEVFLPGTDALLREVAAVLAGAGKATDGKAVAPLLEAADGCDAAALETLEELFLYGGTAQQPHAAKLDRFPTKDARAALGPRLAPLQALMSRVEVARPRRLALSAAERSDDLARFAAAFLPAWEAAKARRGWLDFDDLIRRARRLLSDPAVAAWVLWKLDGGVDHILVDEAQDTSPAQWEVIDLLAREFMAGQGARDRRRTIFVVGDKKQSIYSFQGADLQRFDAMEARFRTAFAPPGPGLVRLSLDHSFRSSPVVLRLVDQVFDEARGRGLGGEVRHLAFFGDRPGRIDLWPALPPATAAERRDWFDPTDLMSEEDPAARLARAIAAHLRDLLASGTRLPTRDGVRRLRPGDVLILVQRRSDLFAEIIRACKAAGLPIAGADRLKVGAELAVKDIAAVLSFLATPEDDLSLAAALRSPLFGWGEDALYDLAQGRSGYLWAALRASGERHAETRAVLTDLRDQADFLRPYDLIERLLTRHGGRARLVARLGAEAEDGIDALLSQALAYEQAEVPSLTGFVAWLGADDVDIKRVPDAASDLIRVMTVHGAKGLEAPLVILPDTAARRLNDRDMLVTAPDGTVLWRPAQAEAMPPALLPVLAERRRAAEDERRRLLYVAMTRAESWLVVAAAGDTAAQDAWYAEIATAMADLGALTVDTPVGPGLRLAEGEWPAPEPVPSAEGPRDLHPEIPPPPPPAVPAPGPVAPSSLGGAKALPGEAGLDEAAAKARGTLLHRLLEHLPEVRPEDRAALADRLLAEAEPALALGVRSEALAVLAEPALAPLFAPGALAEVEIAAPFGTRRLLGTIDRLLVEPDRVLAVDYKSNAVVPATAEEVPEGLLRQMAAYAHALEHVFPGRSVETAILWTLSARLMPLPAPLVRRHLAAALLDAGASHS